MPEHARHRGTAGIQVALWDESQWCCAKTPHITHGRLPAQRRPIINLSQWIVTRRSGSQPTHGLRTALSNSLQGTRAPKPSGKKANHHENIFDPLAFVKISVPNVGTRTPTPARINCHAVAKFTHPKLSLFYRKVSLLVPCYIQKIP